MGKPKRLKVAVLTFTAALGSGLIMQYGDAVASRWGVDAPISGPESRSAANDIPLIPVSASAAAPQLRSAPALNTPRVTAVSLSQSDTEDDTPAFDLPSEFMTAALETDITTDAVIEDAMPSMAAEIAPMEEPALTDMMPETTEIASCDVGFQAAAAPLAMVSLTLDAPCHADMPLVIHHQGMMFHAITDDAGKLSVEVPALAEEAFFIAAFDDGEGAVAITGVPDLSNYDRAVLQWQGESGVQLHAREFGAIYGEPGHVWADAAGDLEAATLGSGGVLTTLGNANVPEALIAEIYTFPSGYVSGDGAVLLSVEAEVTGANCGRDVVAQTIQIAPDQEPTSADLAMTMPDCDSVGDFLVLNNMFEDLTLAAK